MTSQQQAEKDAREGKQMRPPQSFQDDIKRKEYETAFKREQERQRAQQKR